MIQASESDGIRMLNEKRQHSYWERVIGTKFEQPAPSKHRSKRLWKKLRRRTAEPIYGPVHMSINRRAWEELTDLEIPLRNKVKTLENDDCECTFCRLGVPLKRGIE
jgi:hypothetical protein